MPRVTWISSTVDVFIDELSRLGMSASREHAAELMHDRVNAVAQAMRISLTSARRYVTEDVVRDLARDLAVEFADEQPGADTLDLPRDVPVALPLLGRAVAGMAEAIRVHLANDSAETAHARTDHIVGELSTIGQMLSDCIDGQPLVPAAVIRRVARYLDRAADILTAGGALPNLDPSKTGQLAGAFRRDAALLRATLPNDPT